MAGGVIPQGGPDKRTPYAPLPQQAGNDGGIVENELPGFPDGHTGIVLRETIHRHHQCRDYHPEANNFGHWHGFDSLIGHM
jgi:hypothetical protein